METTTTAPVSTLLQAYTILHVAISLLAIFSGFVVWFGLLTSKPLEARTKFFLITTVLTSVTGFFFPFHGITPGLIVGVISLVVLAIAIYARYPCHLAGGWRKTYVITAMIALYLNVFVLIVQSFMKVPALHALAPTQTEPPFKIAQLITLLLFIVLTTLATLRFRPAAT
jgi:hypothetical protein